MEHEGRAVVFEDCADLAARIDSDDLDVDGRRHPGAEEHRAQGRARHARGRLPPIPRKLARAGVKDMVRISDGRMSGTAFGTIVLHVTPNRRSADRSRMSVAATVSGFRSRSVS
jgi:dihydroxy-acid dehydratase